MVTKASREMGNFLWWLAFLSLLALYCAHFVLIQTANMPLSPLQLSLNKPLYYWVHPYFGQRWSFFAPTPPDRDRLLVARGRFGRKGRARGDALDRCNDAFLSGSGTEPFDTFVFG